MWSDLHLGHSNAIEYQGRLFLIVDDMNAELRERRETVVFASLRMTMETSILALMRP